MQSNTYSNSNWADKLTSYNGEDIVYDAIGNPLEYRGWELEWSRGRKLDKVTNLSDNINISYKYDENGVRTQKTVNGVQTDFITSGIKVLAQKSGENTIVWQIDGNGNTVGFNYNGTPYFYIKNAQGDIIAIADIQGNLVAKYTYDSWGKLISIKDSNDVDKTTDENFIGYVNPIRYRGYYYDSETGLYYLSARYYDPEVGRFISADDYEILLEENYDLLRYNIFIYCSNNPIMGYDPSGNVVTYMNPKDIRFSQDSISSRFQSRFGRGGRGRIRQPGEGRPIKELIDKLKDKNFDISKIPPIKIFPSDWIIDYYPDLGLTAKDIVGLERGIMFTLDNRRLYCFQQSGKDRIPVEMAKLKELYSQCYKLSTFGNGSYNFGKTIFLRRDYQKGKLLCLQQLINNQRI